MATNRPDKCKHWVFRHAMAKTCPEGHYGDCRLMPQNVRDLCCSSACYQNRECRLTWSTKLFFRFVSFWRCKVVSRDWWCDNTLLTNKETDQ